MEKEERVKSLKTDEVGDGSKRKSFFIGDQENVVAMKIVGPNDKEIPLEEVVIAPDGGWGWIIVLASFLSNVVVDGTVYSFGILLNPIHEASGKTIPISTIAWIGSLSTGFYFFAGPVVSAVANRYGFRVVAIIGSIMASSSILMTWVLCRDEPVILALFILYGVIGGIGFGMIYVPAVVAVGFYFDHKRALATGIAICGSGIGTFILPPLMNIIIERFGWQAALLFQSGIIISCALFGLLYRPLKPTKERKKSTTNSLNSPEGTPLLQRLKKARDMEKWDSVNSFVSNEAFPPDPEIDAKTKSGRLYIRVRKASAPAPMFPNNNNPLPAPSKKRMSVPSMVSSSGDNQLQIVAQGRGKGVAGLVLPDLKEMAEEDQHNGEDHPHAPSPIHESKSLLTNKNTTSSTFVTKIGSSMLIVDDLSQSRVLRVGSKVSLAQPMYRDDIFLGRSLLRLPQYANNVNAKMSSAEWAAAVSSVPAGIDPDQTHACCSTGILKKMLDTSLLASPTFLLLALSGFFTMLGLFVPFIYLKGMATESVGLSVSAATNLVSVIGIANTAGRVVSGWVADRPEINVLFLNNASITIIGLATASIPFLDSFYALVGFACVFGLAMACYASIRSILIVELLGLENLTNAFGLSMVFCGIASIIGTPLAGFLYERTGAYDVPFFVAGGFIVLSGVMCYPLNYVKRWESDKKKEKEAADV